MKAKVRVLLVDDHIFICGDLRSLTDARAEMGGRPEAVDDECQ